MTQPRRKGKPGRLEVWQDKKTIAYAYFRPKLEALKSFEQAQALWQESPSQINPGYSYYTNLGHFLQHFKAPDGASREELALYLELARKMDAAGELKVRTLQEVEESIRGAMESRDRAGS